MNNLERRLRDQRTIEAIRKNFMGFAGKLAAIAKTLGSSIQVHGAELYDITFYSGTPDLWDEAEDDLPTAEWDTNVASIGYVFDGLSRGQHIEIFLLKEENKITVNFKGYKVYEEMNGKLEDYAPFEEWESLIDILYKQAQNEAKQRGIVLQDEKKEEEVQKKESFLKELRTRWGI